MVKINQDIIAEKAQLYALNDQYVSSNFDETYKRKIDSLRGVLSETVAASSDKYITNPMSTKQDLVTQKLMMEMSLKLAENSVGTIGKELDRLNRKFNGLVPHEAVIQSFENAIDVASREYLEILDKFNETSMTSSFSITLRQIQEAMPGSVQPSKKMLLTILSGIISFIFCVFVLFILFYLDNSITEPKELLDKTGLSVLGSLSTIKSSGVDLKDVWQSSSNNKDVLRFRNELRAIRFEVDHEMADDKILTVTSLIEGEGKTFLAISLAYAYSMTEKKVLLIDGNFTHPSITEIVKPTFYLEDYLKGKGGSPEPTAHSIHLLGNTGGGGSLAEVAGKGTITAKLQELKSKFDIIIIETAALSGLDKSKEWLEFSDRVVGIFETGKTITEPKKSGVAYLAGLGKVFAGWVLNRA
jgi:Mrp family chromosome partitioning ATPase